jgi:hypothetical protein
VGRKVRRVPLDFAWPLRQRWPGYVKPDSLDGRPCEDCEGTGASLRARQLYAMWYGKTLFFPETNGSKPFTAAHPAIQARARRNINSAPHLHGWGELAVLQEAVRLAKLYDGAWCHHLNADDVAALIAAGRLITFTHHWDTEQRRWIPNDPVVVPTPEQVNEWSLQGFGHDGINASVVIHARCERDGVAASCATCKGEGDIEAYPGQREESENWTREDPPTGEGWQLWETITDGSPISPVFDTAQGLARWLTTPEGAETNNPGDPPMPYDVALAFVMEGHAFTFYVDDRGVHEGSQYVAMEQQL